MITILEKGKLQVFITVCDKCSCKFSYDKTDLAHYTRDARPVELGLECPTCREIIYHNDVVSGK